MIFFQTQGNVIGLKINNYEITSLLGEGGMGSVYVAEHPVLGRRVAIKLLRREFAEDKTLVSRFMNEARAATAIRQPNIIQILDVGTLPDGIPYLMMELLEGETLARRIFRETRLATDDAVAIACQAATALEAAHAKGIVHRDLKPDNLFLVPDENAKGGQRVVVLDFGIAKLRGELSSGSVHTHTGSVMGTPPYMSPEQCRGLTEEIDHRTDIYALGIILHEMLSGTPPFVSAGFGDLLIMHITKPPTPLRSLERKVPAPIEAAVLRALEKERDARFQSMAELKAALLGTAVRATVTRPRSPEAHAIDGPRTISTLTSTTGERLAVEPEALLTMPARRGGRLFAAAGAGLAAAAIAVVVFTGSAKRAPVESTAPSAATAPPASPPPANPVTAPAAPPSPAPAVAAPPPPPAEAPPAPEVIEPPRPIASKPKAPSKAKASSRSSRAKVQPAQASRPAAPPAPAPAASAPPPAIAPAPVAPAPKPKPKLSAEKW